VAHVRWSSTLQRLLIDDVRANGAFMRVTVHEDAGAVVFSHWQGDLCVAATRIPLSALPDLVDMLGGAATER
jgi:hypothetical protein